MGYQGNGTLNVEAGGVVSNTSGYIGHFGSTSVATVTGANSQWNNSNSLYIGEYETQVDGSGTLNIYDSGLVTVSNSTKLQSTGAVNLDGSILDTSTLDLTEGIFNMLDGRLHANSILGDINVQGGIVAPGKSPGVLSITGDYTQGAAATLEIELGGVATEEFDQLTSTGTANLDGSLDLLPRAPYTDPHARGTSDDFVIVTAGDRDGTFSTVQYDGSQLAADVGPDANGSFRSHQGNGMFRNIRYTSTTVELQNLLSLEGDVDGDRDVDITDFDRLAHFFDADGRFRPNEWLEGNFDGDDDIDITDFNFLASNFAPNGYGMSAVPEPSAFLLASMAVILLGGMSLVPRVRGGHT